jgi:predicted CXXCH cytochrome family protein
LTALLLLLLAAADGFVGPQACEPCHGPIYARQSKSHHANALSPMAGSAMEPLMRSLRERGGAAFRYEQNTAIVESGGDVARMPLEWAFGAGSQAFTAVGRLEGGYVEHRVSWYRRRDGLGLTPGHDPRPSTGAVPALGIVQSPETMYRCFNCHAANVKQDASRGPDLSAMIPGVTCERCHGPGQAHIEAAKAGRPLRNTVLNPGRLPPRQQVNLCAECHRSPDTQFRSEAPEVDDPLSVRFAPVGFTASRCFQKSTAFSCLTCHNPHQDPRPAADPSYKQVCLKCHAKTKAHARPAAAGNCVTCHMKTTEPAAFLRFTDHRIRVYPR